MGAIASGGVLVLNEDVIRGLGISPEAVQQAAEREGRELHRREQAYREGRPPPDFTGRTVILVDDGLATGASMRAAVQALRQLRARPDRGRGSRRARVHLPRAGRHGRRDGLCDHTVAFLRGRTVLLGLRPDHRRGGAGPAARRVEGAPGRTGAQGPTEVASSAEAAPVGGRAATTTLFDLVGDAHFVLIGEAPTAPTSSTRHAPP